MPIDIIIEPKINLLENDQNNNTINLLHKIDQLQDSLNGYSGDIFSESFSIVQPVKYAYQIYKGGNIEYYTLSKELKLVYC